MSEFRIDGGEMAHVSPDTKDALKDHLLKLILGSSILGGQTPGNDIPFFLCPYAPEDEWHMDVLIKGLKDDLSAQGSQVLDLNLYKISIDLLKSTGRWDRILSRESRDEKAKFLSMLQSLLNEREVFVPGIKALVEAQEHKVVFITGIAPVYPILRSSSILSHLQSVLKDAPVVIFFPGRYLQDVEAGFSLKLFGRVRERNYYRAHNMLHMGSLS